MDSSRRRKCVFTDRPFIWRQKTLHIDEFSNMHVCPAGRGDVLRNVFMVCSNAKNDLGSRNLRFDLPVYRHLDR